FESLRPHIISSRREELGPEHLIRAEDGQAVCLRDVADGGAPALGAHGSGGQEGIHAQTYPLILTLAVLGAGALTPVASAATPSTVFRPFATPDPEPQPGGRWGERLVVSDDMNADGVKDIWTSTPSMAPRVRSSARLTAGFRPGGRVVLVELRHLRAFRPEPR
ncbi:MAG: hypothetical protein WKF96_23740, partial [Solirubrobacteraceae bacterium]